MLCYSVLLLMFFDISFCKLWTKGVVHYAINKKDYDLHSQDIIMSTFSQLENEICVKFFNTPLNYTASVRDKVLFISNPDRRKNCPPENYNFTGSVVDMPIGYKCLNKKDITRIVVDMLRASVEQTEKLINSYDLIRKFQEQNDDPSRPTLLSPADRKYINAHYYNQCGQLAQRPAAESRRFGGLQLSEDNEEFYADKMWPMGVVMYDVEEELRDTHDSLLLRYAMNTIEMVTCVVFQEINRDRSIKPRSFLWFSSDGEDMPYLGFREGNQSVSLASMLRGAPGHVSHTLNMLMRVLGVPMMSNRYDRDNFVSVHWKNVEKGKEHYLEKTPLSAWLTDKDGVRMPYSFDSVTHAPANYMCGKCAVGVYTVQPVQDHLWQRALYMGHRSDLSEGDIEMLNILYAQQCQQRNM